VEDLRRLIACLPLFSQRYRFELLPIGRHWSLSVPYIRAVNLWVPEWDEKDGGARFFERGATGDIVFQMWCGKTLEFGVREWHGLPPDKVLTRPKHGPDIILEGGHRIHIKSVADPYQYKHERGWVWQEGTEWTLRPKDSVILGYTGINYVGIVEIISGQEARDRLEPYRYNREKYPTKLAVYERPWQLKLA
jgi:hypothetical protein